MLGDDFSGPDWKKSWDEVWTAADKTVRLSDPNTVHILITLNAQMKPDGSPVEALDAKTREIEALCRSIGGVEILPGHNRPEQQPPVPYQELSAITYRKQDGTVGASPKEHFGFTDALGDPVFEGDGSDKSARRRTTARSMAPATGGRSRPANSCSAIRTRRKRSPAPQCR